MNKPDLDQLFAEYRRVDNPPLPGSFASHVLREIRLRRAEAETGWVSSLFACLRPGMVAASLSVAISVGVLVPGLVRGIEPSNAADGLGLDVFSTSAANMPSGLLR